MFALIPPLFLVVPAERIYPNCSYVLHYANADFRKKKKVPVIASCRLYSIRRTAFPTCPYLCLVHVWDAWSLIRQRFSLLPNEKR